MTALEPFVVEPLLKERIWGGSRLGWHDPPFGEAWIVAEQSPIGSGPFTGVSLGEAVAAAPLEMLGRRIVDTEGAVFPLLIKLVDPAEWLSIQVHPDDALAAELEGPGARGKTEAWYVLEADPGAELIAGVRAGIEPNDVIDVLRHGALEVLLDRYPVREGDAVLVEAGLIHALGPGMFIYEVQQSSDVTYRVSDWGRPATAGRSLHIEQSVRAAKPELRPQFAPMMKRLPNGSFRVLGCEYFELELIDSDGIAIERDTEGRSFAAVTVIQGSAQLLSATNQLSLDRYQSAIVPAANGPYRLEGSGPFRALVSSVP
jgi:mannose-6-phosphate isomerase